MEVHEAVVIMSKVGLTLVALWLAVASAAWATPIDVAVTLTSPADVTTRRAELIDETWGTATLPTTLPTVTLTSNPFQGSLPDVSAVYDYHAAMSNGQVNDSDLYMNAKPNGRVVIMNMGHQGTTDWPSFATGYNTVPMMTALLDMGFSIYAMNMPGDATTGAHNALFSAYGNAAMQYFLDPAVEAMNYWDANSSFSKGYDFVGLSGGGWTGTVLQALDTRVEASILDAGSLPGTQFCSCSGQNLGDAEQNWVPFYSIAGYVDLYLMGASGTGRSQLQILNINDGCCFGPEEWNDIYAAANGGRTWYQQVAYYNGLLAAAATTVPSDFSVVEDSTATQHQISDPFAVDLAVTTLETRPEPESGPAILGGSPGPEPVPEPPTLGMIGLAFAGLSFCRRHRFWCHQ